MFDYYKFNSIIIYIRYIYDLYTSVYNIYYVKELEIMELKNKEFIKDRIDFYQREIKYWNCKRDLLIEKLINDDHDFDYIFACDEVVECEEKIAIYNEWITEELFDLKDLEMKGE